jgi:hypothetical protein
MVMTIYARRNALPKTTEGALKLSSGLSNTSFVGFPLVMAYFGEKELGIAIIYDQVNFTLFCTAGIIVALNSSGRHTLSAGVLVRKLIAFPPFIACMAALILPNFFNISDLDPLFDKLAVTVGPLALFSVGLQLRFGGWRAELKNLTTGLLYKLIIAPALVFAVVLIFKLKGTVAQISVFEAAMPTLVTSGIVAEEYGLHAKLSNLMIGTGIITAFATTALWFILLRNL